jgi:hypothetical protein
MNISRDFHLLTEWAPWDDAIVVSAGKLRKLCDSPRELRGSVCQRRLERTILGPVLLPVKSAQFTQFFRQVWRHTVKSLSLTKNVYPHLQRYSDEPRFGCLQKKRVKDWQVQRQELEWPSHYKLLASYCYLTILHDIGLPLRKKKMVFCCFGTSVEAGVSFTLFCHRHPTK